MLEKQKLFFMDTHYYCFHGYFACFSGAHLQNARANSIQSILNGGILQDSYSVTLNMAEQDGATTFMWRSTNLFSTCEIGVHDALCWVCIIKGGFVWIQKLSCKSLLPVQGDFSVSVLNNLTLISNTETMLCMFVSTLLFFNFLLKILVWKFWLSLCLGLKGPP